MNIVRCPICHSFADPFTQLAHYSYWGCNLCLTLFLHPIPTQSTLDSYYREAFTYEEALTQEPEIRRRARRILRRLRRMLPGRGRMIDIGAGYGFCVDEAIKSGWDAYGIEPSKTVHTQGAGLVGRRLDCCSLSELHPRHRGAYDAAVAIHVIEHVADPFLFVRQASSLLKPGGVLYIETPNLDSWLFYAERKRYTFLTPPAHVYLFSRRSLEIITARAPVIRVQSSTYSHPTHFAGIIKHVARPKEKKQSAVEASASTPAASRHTLSRRIKHLLLDSFIAPIGHPILNWGGKGSILEQYYVKI